MCALRRMTGPGGLPAMGRSAFGSVRMAAPEETAVIRMIKGQLIARLTPR